MEVKLGETIYLDFTTHDPATGAVSDADALPTFEVFENDIDSELAVPDAVIAKRTAKTGDYRISLLCTVANGFEAGKSYNVIASAAVSGVTAKGGVATFVVRGSTTDEILAEIDNGTYGLLALQVIAGAVKAKTDQLLFDTTGNVKSSPQTPVTVNPSQIAKGVLTRLFTVTNRQRIGPVTRGDTLPAGAIKFNFGADWAAAAGDVMNFCVKAEKAGAALIDVECVYADRASCSGQAPEIDLEAAGLAAGEYFYEFEQRTASGTKPITPGRGIFLVEQDIRQ